MHPFRFSETDKTQCLSRTILYNSLLCSRNFIHFNMEMHQSL
jgi:hypothetical protein